MAGLMPGHRVKPQYKRQVECMTLAELMTYFQVKLDENERVRKQIQDTPDLELDPARFERLRQELLAVMERIMDLKKLHGIFETSRKEESYILRAQMPDIGPEMSCDKAREVIGECLSLSRAEMLKTQIGAVMIHYPYVFQSKGSIGNPFAKKCRKALATMLSKVFSLRARRRHVLFEDPKQRLIVIVPVKNRRDFSCLIRTYILDFLPLCHFDFSIDWDTHVVCGACLWEPRTFPVILEGGSRRAKKMESMTFSSKLEEAFVVANDTGLDDVCYLVSNLDSEGTFIRTTDPAILEEKQRLHLSSQKARASISSAAGGSGSPGSDASSIVSKSSSFLRPKGALSRSGPSMGGVTIEHDSKMTGSTKGQAMISVLSTMAMKKLRERDRLGDYGAALLSRMEQQSVNPLYEFVRMQHDDGDEIQARVVFKRLRNFVRKRVMKERKAHEDVQNDSTPDEYAGLGADEENAPTIIVGNLFNFQCSSKGNGDTLLMSCLRKRLELCAAYMCHEQSVRDGLDFSLQNNQGYTALMMAVEYGASLKLTGLIYSLTPSPKELTNEKGQNVVDLATALGKGPEWIRLLKDEPMEESKEEPSSKDTPPKDEEETKGDDTKTEETSEESTKKDESVTDDTAPADAAGGADSKPDGDSAVGVSLDASQSAVQPPAEMDAL